MREIRQAAILLCLMVLALLAAPAGAQGPATLSNVTVSFGNGLRATFASATAPQGMGGGPSTSYRQGPAGGIQMPAIAKDGNLTLTQGSFPGSSQFWQWHDQILMNTIARATIVVSGIGPRGNPVNWVLQNAWPIRIAGAAQDGGSVWVDCLEISYEQAGVQEQ